MPQNEHDIVQGIVISRKNLMDLVIVAVLLAFGINLIASQFLALPIATPIVTTLLEAVICLASIFYIAKNLCNYSGLLETCQSPRRHVE